MSEDKEEEKFNFLVSTFEDEDYIYLTKEDFEELKNSIPINNLLTIINHTACHSHTKLSNPLPSFNDNKIIKTEKSASEPIENATDEDSTLLVQSSSEDLSLKQSADINAKMKRENSTISQTEEDDKDKESENDMYKKKKFKKIKLTNDLKNKLDMILKQYKDDKWQTIKNMLSYIKDINTSNPRYIELNIDVVHTVILNGLQNSRTAISRQALSILSEVFLVQLDNLSPWLPQFFDILLSRLTSPQQFIVDDALNVIFQIQPLLPGKYYITQIKNAIAASNNPIHKSYYIKCLSSLFETIGKKIEDYSPAYFELLTRVNDNVPEQIKVFNTINNTLCEVYGEDNVDSFLKSILKPPIYNAFKLLLLRKDKTQTTRSSTPIPNNSDNNNNNKQKPSNNENDNSNTETLQQQQVPMTPPASLSEPIKIQKPEEEEEVPIPLPQSSQPTTIIRRPIPTEEEKEEEEEEQQQQVDMKNEESVEDNDKDKEVEIETNNEMGNTVEEEGNNNDKIETEQQQQPKEDKLLDINSSSYSFENGNSKFKFSSKDDVENRLMRLWQNSKAFLESMDQKIERLPLSTARIPSDS